MLAHLLVSRDYLVKLLNDYVDGTSSNFNRSAGHEVTTRRDEVSMLRLMRKFNADGTMFFKEKDTAAISQITRSNGGNGGSGELFFSSGGPIEERIIQLSLRNTTS
jgi:hypothetical protein